MFKFIIFVKFLKILKIRDFFYEIREQNSIFNKFLKTTKFFHEIRELFFVFVLKCTQREHVHNLNRRWARSTLKALVLVNYLCTDCTTNPFSHIIFIAIYLPSYIVVISPQGRLNRLFKNVITPFFA